MARRQRAQVGLEDAPRRLLTIAVWLLCGLAPAAVVPGVADATVPLKLTVVAAGVAVALAAPVPRGVHRHLLVAAAVGLSGCLLAALVGPTPLPSLLGRYPRYEGLPVLGLYLGAVVVGSRITADSRLAELVPRVLALSSAFTLGVAVVQVAVDPSRRPPSTLGNASDFAAYGVLVVGACLPAALRAERWSLLGVVCGTGSVLASGSRGALLGLLVIGVVTGAQLVRASQVRLAALVGGGVALLAVAAALLPGVGDRVLGRSPLAQATASGRRLLWEASLRLLVDRPLTGAGPSGFVDLIGAQQQSSWAASVGPANPPDGPHNLFLQVGSAAGAFGLLVGLVSVVLVLRMGWCSPLLPALLGYATALQFHFTSVAHTPIALLLVGTLVAVNEPVRRLLPATAASGALALLALLAVTGELVRQHSYNGLAAGRGPGALSTARALEWWSVDGGLRDAHALSVAEGTGLVPAGAAVRLSRSALHALPHSTEARAALAVSLDHKGSFAEARAVLDAALRDDPVNVNLLLERGVVAAEDGDATSAERDFRQAARLRPSAREPWEDLVTLFKSTDQPDELRAAEQELRTRYP